MEHNDCYQEYLLATFSTDGTFSTFNIAAYREECSKPKGQCCIVYKTFIPMLITFLLDEMMP